MTNSSPFVKLRIPQSTDPANLAEERYLPNPRITLCVPDAATAFETLAMPMCNRSAADPIEGPSLGCCPATIRCGLSPAMSRKTFATSSCGAAPAAAASSTTSSSARAPPPKRRTA
eukprot:CAMPEP_0115752466 /NCGR_PEP_ID=MMETSP0272-20121206/95806_1 /TAXON_ID=71861 /ORGANISM="Scrippsiella trochoidea, Strain CCMP3099" /LENGTH=115 /DNA_ID=CAMNT_0003197717 /DNA_START=99 /DNA_END=443 /DNA_ORIENTATION=+